MPKVTTNQRVHRVVGFVMGLRDPEASQPLVPYGLTPEELDTAHQLLRAATEPKLNHKRAPRVNPTALARLDAIDNHWYPIIRFSLSRRFPKIEEWVFLNLVRTQGLDLVVAMRTLFSRVKALGDGTSPFGAEGQAAFATLQDRGLTDGVLQEIYDFLDSLKNVEPKADTFDSAEYAEAVDRLWGWYLEWGGIARTVIKDARILRLLGFRRSKNGPHLTPAEEQQELETREASATTAQPTTAAQPSTAASSAVSNGAATNGASLNGAAASFNSASSNGGVHA